MTKRRATLDIGPKQLLLPFHSGGTNTIRAGRLCRKDAVREALTEALAACQLSREAVAVEMSRLTGEAVSVNHLNNWCSEAKREWRFPLELATAFCLITCDFGLISAILDGTGRDLANEESKVLEEYGRVLVQKRKAAIQERKLLEKLGV